MACRKQREQSPPAPPTFNAAAARRSCSPPVRDRLGFNSRRRLIQLEGHTGRVRGSHKPVAVRFKSSALDHFTQDEPAGDGAGSTFRSCRVQSPGPVPRTVEQILVPGFRSPGGPCNSDTVYQRTPRPADIWLTGYEPAIAGSTPARGTSGPHPSPPPPPMGASSPGEGGGIRPAACMAALVS